MHTIDVNELFSEFRTLFAIEDYTTPTNTDAVMVLSAPAGSIDGYNLEATNENIARIELGVEVFKKIAHERGEHDLGSEKLPLFILTGDDLQLPMMFFVAVHTFDLPKNRIVLLSSGPRTTANSKTHFTELQKREDLRELKYFTIITSAYHGPRIARTARKNLPSGSDFTLILVPLKRYAFNVTGKVKGEIRRIIDYVAKGDIAKN